DHFAPLRSAPYHCPPADEPADLRVWLQLRLVARATLCLALSSGANGWPAHLYRGWRRRRDSRRTCAHGSTTVLRDCFLRPSARGVPLSGVQPTPCAWNLELPAKARTRAISRRATTARWCLRHPVNPSTASWTEAW